MPRHRIVRPVLAAFLVLGGLARPVFAEWRRIDSPNFVVVGDVSAGELREITRRFESFREVLARVLTEKFIATAVPTVVVVFPSDRAFTPFKPKFNGKPIELSGLFLPRRDVNYIAMVRDWDEDTMRIVFHEYSHLITSNIAGSVPVWLNEGLAEFYSTFQLVGDREAMIGRPVPGHLQRLNERTLLSLEELLSVKHDSPLYNEGDRRSIFYAQSWALTHLLLVAQPSRRDKLGAYVASVDTGIPPLDAWQRAFAADRIDRELQNYVRRSVFSVFRFRFTDKTTSFDGSATPMTAADAEAFLAHFLVQQQRYDEAIERLDRAGPAASGWPAVVRAGIALSRKESAAAEKALAGLPSDPDWLTAYFAGVTLADTAAEGRDAVSGPRYQAARRYLDAALKARGEIPNAIARTVALELRSTRTPSPEALEAAERARDLAPGREDYVFLNAQVLAQMNRYPEASTLLRSLASSTSRPEVRESATNVLRQIEDLQRLRAASDARRAAVGNSPAAAGDRLPGTSTVPEHSEPRFAPSWRPVGAGEERVEGELERIECAAKSVAFVLKVPEGTARFDAAALDQIEFITYRDDLRGSIGCGPLLGGRKKVYLTRAIGADRKTSRVVAVEFLPKEK
jgi:tetratricopeptide (TPR) repeat protein